MVHIQSPGGSPVTELDVDDKSVRVLCQLGLHAACPRIQNLTLSCWGGVTGNLTKTACSAFSHLTELHVKPYPMLLDPLSLNNAVSLCDAVVTSCPRLIKLSITDIKLDNEVASEIIRGTGDHTSLEQIT